MKGLASRGEKQMKKAVVTILLLAFVLVTSSWLSKPKQPTEPTAQNPPLQETGPEKVGAEEKTEPAENTAEQSKDRSREESSGGLENTADRGAAGFEESDILDEEPGSDTPILTDTGSTGGGGGGIELPDDPIGD